MPGYYSEQLAAERLQRCYRLAPRRVREYLNAEVNYVATLIRPSDRVLELGCGYGRVLARLMDQAVALIGVDTSMPSLLLARHCLRDHAQAIGPVQGGPGPNRGKGTADDSIPYRGPKRAVDRCHQYRDREGAAGQPGSEPSGVGLSREGASICCVIQMDAGRLAFRDSTFDVVFCIQNGLSAINVDPHVLMREAVRIEEVDGSSLFCELIKPKDWGPTPAQQRAGFR